MVEKKKIAFVLYRAWAYEIYQEILAFQKENPNFLIPALITTPSAEFSFSESNSHIYVVEGNDGNSIDKILAENDIDVVFYYGWSWIVKEPTLSRYLCMCLHPSPLPKYRGGSPIQNQIIAGEVISAVSVFKMGVGIDDGDVYAQASISLEGSLTDILGRVAITGTRITKRFIEDLLSSDLVFIPQNSLKDSPPHKRRKANESEIKLKDLAITPYIKIYNMVRALADPYPNAFIVFPISGKTLYIQEIERCDEVSIDALVINNGYQQITANTQSPIYICLVDGFARITKYRVEKN